MIHFLFYIHLFWYFVVIVIYLEEEEKRRKNALTTDEMFEGQRFAILAMFLTNLSWNQTRISDMKLGDQQINWALWQKVAFKRVFKHFPKFKVWFGHQSAMMPSISAWYQDKWMNAGLSNILLSGNRVVYPNYRITDNLQQQYLQHLSCQSIRTSYP